MWINENQTIDASTKIDLEDTYAYIDIEYALNGSSSYIVQRAFSRSHNQVLQGMLNMSSDEPTTLVSRSFVFDGNSVTFNAGYAKKTNQTTATELNTNRCVPRRVYGYK